MTSTDIQLRVEDGGLGCIINDAGANYSEVRNASIGNDYAKTYIDISNDYSNYIVRTLLPINTEGISANLTSGHLHLYIDSCSQILPDDKLCIVDTNQNSINNVTYTDYSEFNITIGGSINLSAYPTLAGSWHNVSLNATGLSWINNLSYTKLGLRTLSDINSTEPTGAGAAQRTYIELNQNLSTEPPSLHLEYGGESNVSEFLSASPTINGALDPAAIINSTLTITPAILGEVFKYLNATFNISVSLTSELSQQYVINATFNLSGDMYIQATKEADTYIDDGGFWVFGKV